ncbi:MAG: NAD(P)H-dependent oxidoreductase subunit E, partial [Anaerolineae bacterium]|nr:NAD(P)H-dependent oxidoreductase subunit E [Anaerolineae bacterium]
MNTGASNVVTPPESIDLSLMDPIFAKYGGNRGALIPILQNAQELYNYLPKEVLQLIARQLGLSVSKVYGVATFYAQFYLERRG